MIENILEIVGYGLGVALVLIIILLPTIATIIFGTYLATFFGLTGLVWYSFVVVFWFVIIAICSLPNVMKK